MIPKERALPDFMEMNRQCRSWMKLTDEEKERFEKQVIFNTESRLFGTYSQRYKILNAIYDAYLMGLGKFGIQE